MSAERVGVVGGGFMGGTHAAAWAALGVPVTIFAEDAADAAAVAALLGAGTLGAAYADPAQLPITDKQKQTAQQVAQAGVPLSELAPNAPDRYTVKKGDTLLAIARKLKKDQGVLLLLRRGRLTTFVALTAGS